MSDIQNPTNTKSLDSIRSQYRNRFEKKKGEMAMEFERVFAKHLVKELTEGSFKMGGEEGMFSSSSKMYRRHIVDTLANHLAKEKQLGMADMLKKHWDLKPQSTPGSTSNEDAADIQSKGSEVDTKTQSD